MERFVLATARQIPRVFGESATLRDDASMWQGTNAGGDARTYALPIRLKELFDVFQTSRFAAQRTQVVEFGAPNFGRAQHIHFVDHL